MALQTYLIHTRHEGGDADAAIEEVVALIAAIGGFVLMALSTGGLIVAFDDQHAPTVQHHRRVGLCGGVMLDPNGAAARQLRAIFAQNMAAQIAVRAQACATGAPAGSAEYPPGYRPLRWHGRTS